MSELPIVSEESSGIVAVVVASCGRPILIASLLALLGNQSRIPDYVVLSCTSEADLPAAPHILRDRLPYELIVCYGPAGVSRQRNNGLRWLSDNSMVLLREDGFVVFLDDDFIMRSDWIHAAVRTFQENKSVVGLTGVLLADGTVNQGYTMKEAQGIVHAGRSQLKKSDWRLLPGRVPSLYGCNMAVRSGTLRFTQFDETLPLYGWLEDYDFSRRLALQGNLERISSLVGVHLAHKHGRTTGVRFGYSQVANPLYLLKKGTLDCRFAIKLLLQCAIMNLLRSCRPEPYIDRRGRLKGNMKAIRDLLFMELDPRNVERVQ